MHTYADVCIRMLTYADVCVQHENSCSVVSTSFGDDPKSAKIYYVVGTAEAIPSESEPQQGRILIFQVFDRKLQLVCSKDVKGAAFHVLVCVCECVWVHVRCISLQAFKVILLCTCIVNYILCC